MKNPSILIFVLIAILLGSCAKWKQKERIAAPVWSDDNSEIAYILNKYEYKRNYPTGGDVKNEYYSIFLTNKKFDGDFEVSESFKGYGEDLFYMKESGYIVSGSFSDKYLLIDATTGNLLKTFSPTDSKICKDKAGNFQTINVIPSISGGSLAVLETRSDCTIDISFWEKDNEQWMERNSFKIPGNDFDAVTWVNSNNLLISACEEFCTEKFYLINVTEGAEEVIPTDDNFFSSCLFVSTSSSWINKSGEFLYTDKNRELKVASIWDDEELVVSHSDFNEEYYQPGCDDFD